MARSSSVRFALGSALAFVFAGACASNNSSSKDKSDKPPAPAPENKVVAEPAAKPPANPAPTPAPTPPAVAKTPAPAAPKQPPADEPPPVAVKRAGHDFIAEAKLLFQATACRGDASLPAKVADEKAQKRHCKYFNDRIDRYKKSWLSIARPFFDKIVPSDGGTTVVYPFGGGDLMTALAVFPNLTEVTTLSLEPSGDPRAIRSISRAQFERYWSRARRFIASLLVANHSRTVDMIEAMNFGKLPGEVIYSLFALAIHDMEPVSLRYFEIQPDGSLKYYTAADFAAADKAIDDAKGARAKRKAQQGRTAMFRHMELTFRKTGGNQLKVHRHIRENLGNAQLKKDGRVIKHLEAKGKVLTMTKAASYLLWNSTFSIIRNYLLKNTDWMISDATGVPPRYARKAGFEQLTWGRFVTHIPTMGNPGPGTIKEFAALWKKNPYQPLKFRFGYAGGFQWGLHHLMVTRRKK